MHPSQMSSAEVDHYISKVDGFILDMHPTENGSNSTQWVVDGLFASNGRDYGSDELEEQLNDAREWMMAQEGKSKEEIDAWMYEFHRRTPV